MSEFEFDTRWTWTGEGTVRVSVTPDAPADSAFMVELKEFVECEINEWEGEDEFDYDFDFGGVSYFLKVEVDEPSRDVECWGAGEWQQIGEGVAQ